MEGNLMLGAALAASLAVMLMCSVFKVKSDKLIKQISAASLVLVTLTSIYLWWLIFNNRFDIAYVASYSSTELP
ncbi:MAG: cytochrome C biogenesis protein, partial [Selenomonadaceae bacterium]|nr:cytochrome C biogenesis protein [Selenomonadaceae bacterium]